MIIRSQNKKAIRNFNLISDLVISKDEKGGWEIIACYPYFAQSDCGFAVIGVYSTEEKAIKVLDMIQSAYERYNFFSITYTDGVLKSLERQNGLEETRKQISSVFQMPQDSEV